MKRHTVFILATLLFFSSHSPLKAESAPSQETVLPEFILTVPDNDGYREYLGLQADAGTQFSLSDIDADILLIELFSMYCPFCQEEAPAVNALYQAMKDYSRPEMKIKIIGLGANNSAFEVDHFRSTYNVRFPLFPDPDMKMYEALEGKGTPGFIGCRKGENGRYTIILRQSGGFYHHEEFLSELLRKSGY